MILTIGLDIQTTTKEVLEMSNDEYDYYNLFRRHKKTGRWEEWSDQLQSWQFVLMEDYD